jgi:glycosyltransferase involved in cell wall biosynthesis
VSRLPQSPRGVGLAIVIVGKDVQHTLERVLSEVPGDLQPGIFVVDDGSSPPLQAPGHRVLRHDKNRGYGAAQRTGYAAAMAAGAGDIVLLHGDGQYNTEQVIGLANGLRSADAVLGSRFLEDRGQTIPWWRRLSNRGLTTAANLRFQQRLTDLHTGARAFRTEALAHLPLDRFSDDYVFDQQVLIGLLDLGHSLAEQPMRCSYDDSVQSISFRRSVRYGLGCLWTIGAARGNAPEGS